MNVLIIGATGPTGQKLVQQALAQGHEVTVLVRNPDKFEQPDDSTEGTASLPLHVLKGDVLDPDSLQTAMSGQQAVVSSLGSKLSRKPITLLSEGTKNLIQAMQQQGVRRLVCITGLGAGDSKGHGGFIYDRLILPLLLKEIYKDKDRQEAVVRDSSLDWTIVRPAPFHNGAATGNYRVFTDLINVTASKISRADTAAFVLKQLSDDLYLHQTPLISE
ncbi:putative flavin reductase (plasmid) [Stanieria cyanosphaera PCC 7437]|uniref:Flavin reductase n=1 Tax=Stanieria cyanosphaera (strain ATCC 29371 / PCC 7437) TaxID=111780 RepID=K9Y1L1_STAC7|nr:SDR family oxidoreductase [Stanieria cyanosphaera]AFZ38296.1 putative flavin reductase [Stanieria cyanosphaera PCC 7437]